MRQLGIAIGFLLTACGQPQGGGTCAQAIATSSVSNSTLPAARIVGGFLTIHRWKDPTRAFEGGTPSAADLDVFRCAVSVRFTDPKAFTFQLITANHCTPHNTTERITLEIGADGGYETIPVKVASVDLARRLRGSKDVDVPVRRELATIFKKLINQSNTGELDPQKNEKIITTTGDIEILTASVDGDVSIGAMNLLKKLRASDLDSSKKSSLEAKDRSATIAWENHLFAYDAVKQARMLALFVKRLEKCQPGGSGICKDPTRVRAVLKSQLPTELGPILSDKKALSAAESRYEKAKLEREKLWSGLRPLLQKNPSYLHVHSNFSLRSTQVGADTTQTVGDDAATRYGVATIDAVAGRGFVGEVTKDGMIFKQSTASRLRFQNGDSGTLFSIGGSIPVTVISSLDFGHSTGGASVTALPARKPSSASPSQTKPTSRASEPLTVPEVRQEAPASSSPREDSNERTATPRSTTTSQSGFLETRVSTEGEASASGSVRVQDGKAEQNPAFVDSPPGECG